MATVAMYRDSALLVFTMILLVCFMMRMRSLQQDVDQLVSMASSVRSRSSGGQFESIRWYMQLYEDRRPCYTESSLVSSVFFSPMNQITYRSHYRNKIPKIVHTQYDDLHLPKKQTQALKSWLKLNPDWELWIWTDESIQLFVWNSFPQFRQAFDQNSSLLKEDFVRAMILYRYGGVFADIRLVNQRPLAELLQNQTCLLSQEPREHAQLLHNRTRVLSYSFMACTPSHPYLKVLIKEITKISSPFVDVSEIRNDLLERAFTIHSDKYARKKKKKKNKTWYGWPSVVENHLIFPRFDTKMIVPELCSRSLDPRWRTRNRLLCDQLKRQKFANLENIKSRNSFVDWSANDSWVENPEADDEKVFVCRILDKFILPGGEEAAG